MENKVYIASGWFNPKQADQLERIKALLTEEHIAFYSPKDEMLAKPDEPAASRKEIFDSNIREISRAPFIVANTQDKDMGTIFECGVAYAVGTPILYFAEGLSGPFNLMLAESGYGVSTTIEELRELIHKFLGGQKSKYSGKVE